MAVAVMDGPDQRMNALEKANEVRSWRAREKRGMTLDRAVQIILAPPEMAETWRLADLLLSVPKLGTAKVAALIARTGRSDRVRLQSLSDRERVILARTLRAWDQRRREGNGRWLGD